jgi:hypothetical protein
MPEEAQGSTVLYRPVGQAEFDLIRATGMRRFPPRLEWQPIFYPVLDEEYAVRIAREWNTKDAASGNVGYVTQFAVSTDFVRRYPVREVGGHALRELWVPAEELGEFNDHIIGQIEVMHVFRPAVS